MFSENSHREPQITPNDPEQSGTGKDPVDRQISHEHEKELREKMLDKTLADSFPTSDPPSSLPDPCSDEAA